MRTYFSEEQPADNVPASEWRNLRLALTERLDSLMAARNAATSDQERADLTKRIDEVKQQVQTLVVEESVAQFVEDSERYVIAASTLNEELNRDPDAEPA